MICELEGPYVYDLNVRVLFVETVVDVNAPTETEVLSGVDLLDDYDLTDIIGWEIETEIIVAPPYGTDFSYQRLGLQRIGATQLAFAAERQGADIRTLLQREDTGFIFILPSGRYAETPNSPMNVYPVEVAQVTQLQRLREGGSVILVTFAVTSDVGENVQVSGS